MRIALVSQEYPPQTGHGGISSQTYQKAHGLASMGHNVLVISHSTDDGVHEYGDGDVRVTRIPGFDARLPIHTDPVRWLTYSAEVASALARLHSRDPLDIIDFPEYAAEGYVHLLNRTEWNHIPTVVQLHGPLVMLAHTIGWPEIDSELYRVGTAMEATCLRLADAVFSSSRCSAEWCARHYDLANGAIPIIHSGIDTRHFRPRPKSQADRPTIIFVGKLTENKGINTLVEAACRLAAEWPDLRVRALGRVEPPMERRLKEVVKAHGRPGLLDLVGFVGRDALPGHLSRAHVFAVPSIYEGGPGFAYLEAMACGLPSVACEGSGAAEAVTHGRTGLLVPPGDVAALSEALRRLFSDPVGRESMGRSAREFVVNEADSRACLKRLEGFYLSIIARSEGHGMGV